MIKRSGKSQKSLNHSGLSFAIHDGRIFTWEIGIILDLHVEIRMYLQQPPRQLGRAIAEVVCTGVRPDDPGSSVVTEQPFERRDVCVEFAADWAPYTPSASARHLAR